MRIMLAIYQLSAYNGSKHLLLQLQPFYGPWTLSGTTRVSLYQKGKTNLDLLEQNIVSGSGISWAICKCAPRPTQVTSNMPASHPPLSFLQAGCPSCRPTNSVKALKQMAVTSMPYNNHTTLIIT